MAIPKAPFLFDSTVWIVLQVVSRFDLSAPSSLGASSLWAAKPSLAP